MVYSRVVIVSGGELTSKDIKRVRHQTDWIIAADGGAQQLLAYGIKPHVLVGDFDTLAQEQVEQLQQQHVEIVRLPTQKDMTDTHYACEKALTYKPNELILLGVWGGARMDHAIANLGLLEWLQEQGVQATIYAGTNRLRLLQGPAKVTIQKNDYHYISLLPISKQVSGIYTRGLQYTLHNGTLTRGLTRGISNELAAEKASIQLESGMVLLIETSD